MLKLHSPLRLTKITALERLTSVSSYQLVIMKKSFMCGFNGFQQFGEELTKRVSTPTEFHADFPLEKKLFDCSWSANAYACENKLIIKGFLLNSNKALKLDFTSMVKQLCLGDTFCLVLLSNGDVLKINLRVGTIDKLNFLYIERSTTKKSIFSKDTEIAHDQVAWIGVGAILSVAITNNNVVYNIPTRIYEFPKHERVKSLVCGFEHAMVLTTNGDVYSWGTALRAQLGHGDFVPREIPTLIEALAGIKIVCIAASGWHSAAVSAFGDLYVWGINVDGQLGIRIYEQVTDQTKNAFKHKNPVVYPLPKLMDIPVCCQADSENDLDSCDVLSVSCGTRHTFVTRSCGKIYFTGWNEYGQLGTTNKNERFDKFTLFDSSFEKDVDVNCLSWSTIFIEK